MDHGTQRQRRRFSPKVWGPIVLAVVVLACLWLVIRRGSVERRLQALRAGGYPTSFAELAEYTKLPEGTKNAADVYLDAFSVFVLPLGGTEAPIRGREELPKRGEPFPASRAEAIGQFLTANEKCLALLRRAGAIAHRRYPWDCRDYNTGWPAVSELRSCAWLLASAAISRACEGQTDAAVAYIKDGLRLGDSLRGEPGLASYLGRMACYHVSLVGFEWTLSVTDFADSQLKDLDETLARIAGDLDLTEAMVTDRALLIERCEDPSQLGARGRTKTLLKVPGVRRAGLHDCLDYMAECIAASKLPVEARLTRLHEIEDEIEELSFLHAVIDMFTPVMRRIAELDVQLRAHIELARTALAIERYRLATGEVPAELAVLVPQYLNGVPIDPFDGRPIRYRCTEPGYLLYSIMEDGQDNDGRTRDEVEPDEPYDLCFIVTR